MRAAASATGATNSDWSVHVWDADDGLPNNDVEALSQTPDGYLWLATTYRFARFDGIHFEEFANDDFSAPKSHKITAMLRGRDGGLWLATDRGALIHMNSGKVEAYTNGLPQLGIRALNEDSGGAIWITYRFGSVARFKNGKVTTFSAEEGWPEGSGICSLAIDKDNRVWFTKNGQLGTFEKERFQVVTNLAGGPARTITRLAGSRDGGIWVCSGMQLFKLDQEGNMKWLGAITSAERDMAASALLEDHAGALWIGTSDLGLFRYDGARIESIPTSHQNILSLLEDLENNIWIGTGGGGLMEAQPRVVALEGIERGLPFASVQAISEATNGDIWASTQNGLLARRTDKGWESVPLNAFRGGTHVNCAVADETGSVWISMRSMLHRWRPEGVQSWGTADGYSNQTVHALLPSRTGDLWIGGTISVSRDSLQRIHNGVFENIKVPPDTHDIRSIAEDPAGDIWLGASQGALLRVRGTNVTDETARIGSSHAIRCLRALPDGSLWIGFSSWGVGRLKVGRFSHIDVEQGLFDNSISQILEDGRGWLWFGSDHGIFKARLDEMEKVADGLANRVSSIHFGREQGLPSLQANAGYAPNMLRGRDGRLWMPSRAGVALVDPGRLREEDQKPPIVLLKRVVVDDKTVARYGGAVPVRNAVDLLNSQAHLKLPPGHRRLEFEFTALSLVAPQNVQFSYRLENFDDTWIHAKAERVANYSRLAAGDYRFQVKACNSAGVWNDAGASFAFTVTPFVWQEWWFRLSAILLFTAFVLAAARFVAVRKMRRHLREIEQKAALEKSRMAGMAEVATNVLHNVGNVLNSVNVSNSVISDRVRNSKVSNLGKIAKLLRENADDLPGFFANDPRGRQLLDYLSDLANHLAEEREEILRELGSLGANIEHIKQIVVRQQSYARVAGISESVNLTDLVEDALRINSPAMERHQVQVVREYAQVPPVLVDKHKVFQILINLMSNAKYALHEVEPANKRMVVRLGTNGNGQVRITVIDNGIGISRENLARVFQHGFTTRKEGHGFGLHSSALAARELGGSLTVESEGPGQGATFTLEFPAQPKKTKDHWPSRS